MAALVRLNTKDSVGAAVTASAGHGSLRDKQAHPDSSTWASAARASPRYALRCVIDAILLMYLHYPMSCAQLRVGLDLALTRSLPVEPGPGAGVKKSLSGFSSLPVPPVLPKAL